MMQDPRIATAPPIAATTRRRRLPLTRIVLLVVLAAAIAATAWTLRLRQRTAATATAAAASAASNRVIPVLTAQVAQRDVPVWLEGLGTVSAFYTVTVKTQVDGRLDKVLFAEGQHVKKGDVLAQVDPRPFAIQFESAQATFARDLANLKNARVNLDRYRTLSQQNLIAVQQMTDQESAVGQLDAQIRADQAQIDSARLSLDYARIASPIDGVTGVRLVDPGNVVHGTDATGLVVVTQISPIALLFSLPEDDLPSVKEAMGQGELTVDALSRNGDKVLGQGALSVIDNQINQATATIRLKAVFPNPNGLLWPNQFVKARLRLRTRKSAIVVPAAVVQHGPQGTFAYVVGADSTATVRPVTVDAVQGDSAVVSKGLAPGEQVVTDGQAQLRPGSRVSAKPASSADPGGSDGPTSGAAPGAPGDKP
jgi:membrane fusion protein, multidrug efflux system